MIKVVWISYKKDIPPRDYWDHAMLNDVFDLSMWNPVGGFTFRHYTSFDEVKAGEGCVVVVPARAQTDCVKQLNADLARLKWCVVILTGDEESNFPHKLIKHDNMRLWVMSPKRSIHGDSIGKLPNGYPTHIKQLHKMGCDRRKLDWFFSGQINHKRREECVARLEGMNWDEEKCELNETEGFGQGITHGRYYQKMHWAKVVPCPGGPRTPDSFRLYEALESGCVPVVDGDTVAHNLGMDEHPESYFTYIFNEVPPFPVFMDYVDMPRLITECLRDWGNKSNQVYSWWQGYKRGLVYDLHKDIRAVSGQIGSSDELRDNITVIIPTSPIQSHPRLDIIDETIASIRDKLPGNVEIIIMVDGCGCEDESMREKYDWYVHKLLWKCNHVWKNVLPVVFNGKSQQAIMAEEVVGMIRTPLLLYVEHDAPLIGTFDWEGLVDVCSSGEANVIRFHHEAQVLDEHQYLMIDKETQYVGEQGVPMRKCIQWSQRPHLASVVFYKDMLERFFEGNEVVFIEDRMHGQVSESYKINGLMGWYYFRLWMYTPDESGASIQRSYHLDGKKSE